MIHGLGYIIGFAIGFTRGVVKALRAPELTTDGAGRWGDLYDPPLPCGECDLETDTCSCLETPTPATDMYLRKYGIDGYTVDQLWRDIEELERQQ